MASACCVSRRSPHVQVISLGALKKWPICSQDIKNAFLLADGFGRDVYLRAPCVWNSKKTRRVWILIAPAYGLNDAPVAFRRSLRIFLVNSVESLASVGLRCGVSPFDPRLYFVYNRSGSAVGAIATHIDDILGCGEYGLLAKIRPFSEKRFGTLGAQEWSLVHVDMELPQEKDFSVTSTQEAFTKNLKLFPTLPESRAGRKNPLSTDYIKLRQCKLGELFWVATASRPDMCARLARAPSRINAPCGSDVYRINELVRVVKDWQQATVLKYASPSYSWEALGWGDKANGALRKRVDRVHGAPRTLLGLSDAAYREQSTEGKCRVGYVIGLMSSTLRVLQIHE